MQNSDQPKSSSNYAESIGYGIPSYPKIQSQLQLTLIFPDLISAYAAAIDSTHFESDSLIIRLSQKASQIMSRYGFSWLIVVRSNRSQF
jgi:hypothetical protein